MVIFINLYFINCYRGVLLEIVSEILPKQTE